jgi:hypothetical protein
LNYYLDYNEYQDSIKRIQEQIDSLLLTTVTEHSSSDDDKMVELLVEIGLYKLKRRFTGLNLNKNKKYYKRFVECESTSESIFRLVLLLQRVIVLREYLEEELKEFIGGSIICDLEGFLDSVEEYSLAYWSERMLDGEFMDYNEEYFIDLSMDDDDYGYGGGGGIGGEKTIVKLLYDELLNDQQPDYEYSLDMIRSRREGYCVSIVRDTFL